MMRGPHRISEGGTIDCDVLVVGSGAGGSAVADVLVGAGLDVLMVEEGPMAGPERAQPTATEAFPRLWRCGGLTAALGKPPVAYAEGRCVGGGTEINSAIFQRVPEELLECWAYKYVIESFQPSNLAPFYDRAFQAVNASLTPEPLGEPSEILRRGGEAMGWKVSALERAQKSCVGTNMCSTGCPTGGKRSMSVTLLPAALARGMR